MATTIFTVKIPSENLSASTSLKIVPVETNLVLYGSGYLAPEATGGGHDTGNAFKLIAEARNKINKKKFPKANNKVHYCPTDTEFFDYINNSVNIKRLDVYCHGWLDGINLGGFTGKRIIKGIELDGDKIDWLDDKQDGGKDFRRVETREDVYLKSTQVTELTSLLPNAFSTNVEVYFWGCNIGGQLDSKGVHVANNDPFIKDPKESFAHKFALTVGKGDVYALVGKGNAAGSMFKRDKNKKNVYDDGEMLPANISYNHKNVNTVVLDATKYMKKFPL